ncbi:MAG TPA: ATP-binding cassette domain-containing protein [Actinomycetota bacterium]|nr:ATP-binding cassette domain-containing protein [Actinomycetota bacterium]
MTGPAVLEVRGLTKTFTHGLEPVHALRGATLAVASEEVVALAGPSGSGKTTLLMTLLGWDLPDDGDVVWVGRTLPHLGPLDWGEVALVGQRLGLVSELTIEDNVELPLMIEGVAPGERADRVDQALESLDLGEIADHYPAEASLGEQQRAAIARALIRGPRLLLADEPTSHQDAERKRLVFARLSEHKARGGCCLVATHDPETLAFCDRVLRIGSGALEDGGGA